MQHPASEILATHASHVVRHLLGKPFSVSNQEIRYGRRGSLCIAVAGAKRGLWFDHETSESGDLIDLLRRELGVSFAGALSAAEDLIGRPLPPRENHIALRKPELASTDAGRRRAAQRIWREASGIPCTPADEYLKSRGLKTREAETVLRWHRGISAMIALMTNPIGGEPCGIHRTFLDGDGKKLNRKMLGNQGVIRVSADEEVSHALGICEGVEDALSIASSGWSPIWAATSAGSIARFPVLQGIDCLTVFADSDVAGRGAAEMCVARWSAEARETSIVTWEASHG